MKRIVLVFAFAGILGANSMLAEKNGTFWGVQFGLANAKSQQSNIQASIPTHKSYRTGLLLGYKKSLCSACESQYAIRYYGILDFGTKYNNKEMGPTGYNIYTYNFSFNADVMRNFFKTGAFRWGTFTGLSFGYADHRTREKRMHPYNLTVAGFDLGVNAGLRFNTDNVSIELYSRFGLLEQKRFTDEFTHKIKQPFQMGIRYTFSFFK